MKTQVRVLVVDDDEVDCRMAKRAMLNCPYPVRFDIDNAGKLSEALAKLGASRYDVALLDLGLPDSTGLDTLKKAIVAAGDVPIVVLTGLADDETGLSAIDSGAADYLVKDPSISSMLGRTLLHAMERKKVELNLKKALEAKANLVNMVSHDLRIPLTAIKEGIDIVLGGDAGEVNDEQKDFLSLAKRNIDRLTRLITDFLDIQKIAADKQQFHIKQNDINELIRNVHRTMDPVTGQRGLDFRIELEEKLPRINFDYDGITRVVTNLVSNALKFTSQGGIVIRTRKDDDKIEVAISDSGCGISAEDLKILFEKFGQVKSATVKDAESTGLGLAISKEIVEYHRGKIWAESEFGKGSTFYFYLPALSQPVES